MLVGPRIMLLVGKVLQRAELFRLVVCCTTKLVNNTSQEKIVLFPDPLSTSGGIGG